MIIKHTTDTHGYTDLVLFGLLRLAIRRHQKLARRAAEQSARTAEAQRAR